MEGGHLEALKWLRANGCSRDVRTCEFAAAGAHFEVLRWLQKAGWLRDSGEREDIYSGEIEEVD